MQVKMFTSLLMVGTIAGFSSAARTAERPNIVLIMVDDMGYSDIGCYGGEISTPNIDGLANDGLMMTQFYNNARSCPTRASLLTGLTPHQAGVGWMIDRNLGYDGYVGNLTKNSVTLAEVLKSSGYSTYMSGKWHVTSGANAKHGSEDKSTWPRQRGFDRFFGIVGGAANYWKPVNISLDNQKYPDAPYFITDMIGDYAVDFLNGHKEQKGDDPFFMYVAFNAPHWPLQARQETIDKYMGRYDCGWDEIRDQRYRRMVEAGIIDRKWDMSPRDSDAQAWKSLSKEKRKEMAKRMATYAAQVDEMDQKVGSIVSALKKNGQYENTIILFLTDNGACAEDISSGKDKSVEGIGSEQSWESYRLPWANASATPFRLYKHWMHEGGISTPLIIHWSKGLVEASRQNRTPSYLIDIMATFVDLAGAKYPAEYRGNPIPKMEGVSLVPVIKNSSIGDRYIFLEHEANRMVRHGKWKIVEKASYEYPFVSKWELYDMDEDRTELHNLADKHPQIVADMAARWDEWAKTHNVLPLDGRIHGDRIKNPIFNFPQ